MSDKLSSINNYIVNNISSISTATNIMKRPYDNTTFPPNKKKNKSKDTSKSSKSNDSFNNDSDAFSDLLSNELNDTQKLKNNEQYRAIRANFQSNRQNNVNSDISDDNTNLHAKLNEAMKLEVDTSALCKKIELINSLRKESNIAHENK